jgi:chemosensory pili system protein ChpA (sensor histidine kinase/response regulator)
VGQPEPTQAQALPDALPAQGLASSPVAPATVTQVQAEVDWSRFGRGRQVALLPGTERTGGQSTVRVRSSQIERMITEAGEVNITRARIAGEVQQMRTAMHDLSENLERLRGQLRDIEFQAEVQMSSRMEAARTSEQSFDPLEFDRFTRFQELTRMMAESVNDVATVQRSMGRTLDGAEDALAAQARLAHDLQDDLLRTRMVEFEAISERLYRVVRQAAKETGKQVRLDILGGQIELDRGVLDRMTPAFEHLLRNCVTHGIEDAGVRQLAGKDPVGLVTIALSHEGNEVVVEFRDDGAGLNLPRIREKALALNLLDAQTPVDDAVLAHLIFSPGFSTAETVTELSGRGVGMDVVRNEVNGMGGRIETSTQAGKGTTFRLQLPLTTAVTQVVLMQVGERTVAVPSTLIEIVRRVKREEVEQAYLSGSFEHAGASAPFYWLGALLQWSPCSQQTEGKSRFVVVIRSAQQRVAIHVDDVIGNQEVVVKSLGAQLSRLPGLAGMSLLASGGVALIYNPQALAAVYGEQARRTTNDSLRAPSEPSSPERELEAAAVALAPLVMVVDDSLTVRRVTQRLLERHGYRVLLAKDGLDALEKLADQTPEIVLSDIEMPRMDGFDLVRNLRNDARWANMPVIMITSRIAQKHRDHASQLGVNHYLGKPYSDEELLQLVSRYTHEANAPH